MQTRVNNKYNNGEYSKYGSAKEQALRIANLVRGKVVDNNDPKAMGRVKVRVPNVIDGENPNDYPWAPVMQMGSGNGGGTMIIPEVDTVVLVAFEGNDVNQPIVVGTVITTGATSSGQTYNTISAQRNGGPTIAKVQVTGQNMAPFEGQEINKTVVYKTTNGSVIYMNDDASDEDIRLEGSGGEFLRIGSKYINLQSAKGAYLYFDEFEENKYTFKSVDGFALILSDGDQELKLTNPEGTQEISITNEGDISIHRGDSSMKFTESGEVIVQSEDGCALSVGNGMSVLDTPTAHVVLSDGKITISNGEVSINLVGSSVTVSAASITLDAPVINLGD